MRRFVLIAVACVSCLALVSLPFEASAQPDPFEESRPAIQVIPLSHAAVAEVRGLLGDVAEIQGVEVSIDPRTNCIILIGDADGIEIIQALCQVIDTAPRMIDTEITMYELRGEAAQQSEFTPESLESPDNIRVIRRIRLQSLENQMTEIQLGEMVPVKTGEVFGGGRGGPPGAQDAGDLSDGGPRHDRRLYHSRFRRFHHDGIDGRDLPAAKRRRIGRRVQSFEQDYRAVAVDHQFDAGRTNRYRRLYLVGRAGGHAFRRCCDGGLEIGPSH